jgi:signal transduction histidine kinase
LQTIEKTDYALLWKIVAVGIFIIVWILWWNRKINAEKNKTKIALSELQKAQLSLEENTKLQLEQQQMLLNQSKIASMGEMLANIAHQWRQPLSVISTASTGLLVEKQFHVIDDAKLEKTLNTINEHAQYLSNTINTFSDYIKSNKKVQKVILHDRIQVAINIVEATFKNHYITLETNLDDAPKIETNLVVGELSEALINILNNAKDAIIQNNIKDPLVKIELQRVNNTAVIIIEDNAGGIPDEFISKIFEPYFTTKHQSQGTGLGLHMCYKIVTESLHGKIEASNTEEGARFEITLPLDTQNPQDIHYSI